MKRALALVVLIAANMYVWFLPEPQGISITFFSVGEGDSALIESPTGAKVLIDGGPSEGAVLRGIGSRLPFFDRSLDAIIETTPTASYATGLVGVFDRYAIQTFLTSPVLGDTKTADTVFSVAQKEHASIQTLSRGMRILIGGGAYIDVLFPSLGGQLDANAGALILRVVYGKHSFLLSSGALQKTELQLAAADGALLKSDVLKAGGHGTKTASADAFVAAVSPTYVVFSRGCDNTYHHPAPETVSKFENRGVTLFDTCTNGALSFKSDGLDIEVNSTK